VLRCGHHAIYDAVTARDPDTAEKHTESHIRGFWAAVSPAA
jgi:DNA-binding GntR family transcriptional regulator